MKHSNGINSVVSNDYGKIVLFFFVLIIISSCVKVDNVVQEQNQEIDQQPDFCIKIKHILPNQNITLTHCCKGREYLIEGASCWMNKYPDINRSEEIWERV